MRTAVGFVLLLLSGTVISSRANAQTISMLWELAAASSSTPSNTRASVLCNIRRRFRSMTAKWSSPLTTVRYLDTRLAFSTRLHQIA